MKNKANTWPKKHGYVSVRFCERCENDLKWYILQIFFKPIAITVLDDLSLETISMVSCILDGLALAGLVVCPSCPSLRDKGHLNPLHLAGCGGDYPAFPCRLSFL